MGQIQYAALPIGNPSFERQSPRERRIREYEASCMRQSELRQREEKRKARLDAIRDMDIPFRVKVQLTRKLLRSS
jgi:hypothetical protein